MNILGHLSDFDVILGSGSPRRQELLTGLGVKYRVLVSEAEEIYPPSTPVGEVAEFLSKLKSKDLVSQIQTSDFLLITADTVVIMNDVILGKPTDLSNAKKVLNQIAGETHSVMTGVTIATRNMSYSFSDTTLVTISPMSELEIEYSIENDPVLDKAGSYGIQDWLGLAKVSSLVGSYYNVMGLPTDKLYEVLQKVRTS